MTPEESYRATVRELQEIAERAPHVTQQDVLDIASMPVDELRRRALVARDWHGHFAHTLDGIKELRVMPGAASDGCWSPRQVRSVVLTLVESCAYTWEDDFRGRLKTPAPGVPACPALPTNADMDRIYDAVLRQFAERLIIQPDEVEVDPKKHPSFYRALMHSAWLAGATADGVPASDDHTKSK